MSATTGMQPIGDYTTGSPTNKQRVDRLLALIPDSDAPHGSGAVAVPPHGIRNSWLDEMSPGAAAQLRIELAALSTAVVNV